MNLDLAGKHAIVTGASRGIGRAVALMLAQQGVSVAACYKNKSERAESLARELERYNNGSFVQQVDVSSQESIQQLTETLNKRFEYLDILVNNAGVISHIPLAELTLEEWQRVLTTNLTSMYLMTQAVLPRLKAGGSVINIGSAVATVGIPGRVHYTAAKAGVIGFTRSLCKELGPRQIRVNSIAPGIIDTDQAARLTTEQRLRYANLAALGRLGEPEDIARIVLFLVSDLSSFVSGVTLNVDGGI